MTARLIPGDRQRDNARAVIDAHQQQRKCGETCPGECRACADWVAAATVLIWSGERWADGD